MCLVIVVSACKEKVPINDVDTSVEPNSISHPHHHEVKIDTIIEINSSENLDLSKHQLFIDTNKNSKYYNEILNWMPGKFDDEAVNFYLNEIGKTYKLSSFDLGDFPKNWTSVRFLNGKPVIYRPAVGHDWRLRLEDKSVNFYGVEGDADAISKIITINDSELLIELRTIPQKSENKIRYIKLKKTRYPFVYSVQFSNSENFDESGRCRFATPFNQILNFDLLVSDSKEHLHYTPRFDDVRINDVE